MMKMLFGSSGWPCGMHEIASHVVRLGLAEAEIWQFGDGFDRRLREFRPDIVGLRIEGGRLETVCEQIRQIRSVLETAIILGGPTATSHPVDVLERTGADYVFAGDAEHSVARLVENVQKSRCGETSDRDLSDVSGLAFRQNGRVRFNRNSGEENSVPEIDEKTLRENKLDWSLLHGFVEPMDSLYLTGGRGCPGRCTFCARLHGRTVRTKTARQIIDEVRGADRLVREGRIRLTAWPLYKETDDPILRSLAVSWCSVFDEDFFLDRRRAVEFLQLYEFYGFQKRYRLGFQTNPRSLLDANGKPDEELFYWIKRLKAMIQIGAESFHPGLLRRWKKRHTPEQLETVLDALDRTGQDYNVFQIATDYDTTLDELRESTKLLLEAARKHVRMRIASSPFMIPLYDTELRRRLESSGRLKVDDFTDYETPHPEWMDPEVVDLADRIDEALQDALYPELRESALKRVEEIF